ncbi:MAG: conjugative transposon protein TraM [Chitinophaga rupis]
MLDKIIRIQHPGETALPATSPNPNTGSANNNAMPADSSADNAIPAIISEDQTLVTGATIALRLMDTSRIGGFLSWVRPGQENPGLSSSLSSGS